MDEQKAGMNNIKRFRLERKCLSHIDDLEFDVIREWTACFVAYEVCKSAQM